MKYIPLLLACVCVVPQVGNGNKKTATPAIDVLFRGELRHGILAIGGETTGTTIEADGLTWELELPPVLQTFAEHHHKQTVKVTGTLKRVIGTEIPERWIVAVDSIAEWTPVAPEKAGVQVEFQGKLRTGIVAIGGETTGIEITDDGVTWELELPDEEGMQQRADQWHKKIVLAKGHLEKRKGPERTRFVVRVTDLKLPKTAKDK